MSGIEISTEEQYEFSGVVATKFVQLVKLAQIRGVKVDINESVRKDIKLINEMRIRRHAAEKINHKNPRGQPVPMTHTRHEFEAEQRFALFIVRKWHELLGTKCPY